MSISEDFIKKVLSGDKRSVSRAITFIENEMDESGDLLKRLYAKTGNAYKIGITGPPGAGKSSLTNALVKLLIDSGKKVGVIAVDPTSPYTGGALLGDRIRMQEVGMLDGVFIRSMATRGSLGGLSKMVVEACDVLDASGKDFIIIETVGVGQSELDIAKTADTTIVVLVPESGDAVQAMKAGLMEIADIFVINKADREGANAVAATIKNIIHLKPASVDNWTINVLKTIAVKNDGIDELLKEILKHRAHLETTGYLETKRKNNLTKKVYELVNNKLQNEFWNEKNKADLKESLSGLYSRENDPYSYAEKILEH